MAYDATGNSKYLDWIGKTLDWSADTEYTSVEDGDINNYIRNKLTR